MKPIIIALVLLFFLLQYELWFSNGGIVSVVHLKQIISQQQQKNAALKKRNEALKADIKSLKKGNEAISERARDNLGMIENGETFYQVIHSQNQRDQ